MANPPLKIQGNSANYGGNEGNGRGPPPKKLYIQGSDANYGGKKVSRSRPSTPPPPIKKSPMR
jgi:hypothetical protein